MVGKDGRRAPFVSGKGATLGATAPGCAGAGVSRWIGSVTCGTPPSIVDGVVMLVTGLVLGPETLVGETELLDGERARAWAGVGSVASSKYRPLCRASACEIKLSN
jgi:hypothetical protein